MRWLCDLDRRRAIEALVEQIHRFVGLCLLTIATVGFLVIVRIVVRVFISALREVWALAVAVVAIGSEDRQALVDAETGHMVFLVVVAVAAEHALEDQPICTVTALARVGSVPLLAHVDLPLLDVGRVIVSSPLVLPDEALQGRTVGLLTAEVSLLHLERQQPLILLLGVPLVIPAEKCPQLIVCEDTLVRGGRDLATEALLALGLLEAPPADAAPRVRIDLDGSQCRHRLFRLYLLL